MKNPNKKRNGLVPVHGADAVDDAIRLLDADALKRVTGGFSFVTVVSKSTPK